MQIAADNDLWFCPCALTMFQGCHLVWRKGWSGRGNWCYSNWHVVWNEAISCAVKYVEMNDVLRMTLSAPASLQRITHAHTRCERTPDFFGDHAVVSWCKKRFAPKYMVGCNLENGFKLCILLFMWQIQSIRQHTEQHDFQCQKSLCIQIFADIAQATSENYVLMETVLMKGKL